MTTLPGIRVRCIHPFVVGSISLLLAFSSSVTADGAPTVQSAAETSTLTVEIRNLQFTPAEMTIAAGTTVTWINLDPVDHDVTSGVSVVGRKTRGMEQTKFPDNVFASGLFGQDKSFSITFDAEGEYNYYCDVHPFMVAKILVR